jgi:hypothetical protein
MKRALTRFFGTRQFAVIFLATALLPATARAQSALPSVSANVSELDVGDGQTWSISVDARTIPQGFFLLPSGIVRVMMHDGEVITFEVTGLTFFRVESCEIIVGGQANITALNHERNLTLELELYDENTGAAEQLPPDYHQPFPPGDCVKHMKLGEIEYHPAMLPPQTHVQIDVAIPAAAE